MLPSELGLRLGVIWFDEDMVELALTASNGRFYAQTAFYTTTERIREFGSVLAGFPGGVEDSRRFELGFGDFNPGGTGGARFQFVTKNSRGGITLALTVVGDPRDSQGRSETATLVIDLVPSSIDSFVSELRLIEHSLGSAASLKQAT